MAVIIDPQINALSLLYISVGLLTFILGVIALVREGPQKTPLSYFLLSVIFSVWLSAFAFMFVASSYEEAMIWAKIGHMATPLIPAAAYQFAVFMLDIGRKRRIWLITVWTVGVGFVLLELFADFIFADLYHYDFGFYPQYSKWSFIYITYFICVLVITAFELFRMIINRTDESKRYYFRARLFLVAVLVGYLAAIDFLPFYGIQVMPLGAIPVFIYYAISWYAVIHYRLINITPRSVVYDIMDTMADPLIVSDRYNRIMFTNRACRDLLGYTEQQLYKRKVTRIIYLKDGDWSKMVENSQQSDNQALESPLITKDNKHIETSISCAPLIDHDMDEQLGYIMVAHDIRHYKTLQRRLAYMAEHDTLTGLYNRNALYNITEKYIAWAKRHNKQLCLLYADLDGFKDVNDEYGHHNGDELLKTVAKRLEANVREEDIVSRISGDEFVLVLTGVENEQSVQSIINKLLSTTTESVELDNVTVQISMSIGIAFYPDNGLTLDDLLRQSDIAMYEAKKKGGNTYSFIE